MNLLCFIKYHTDDLFCKVRACKWKFILCVALSVIGFALGIALFCASNYGWWYYNRCDFAAKIITTSFSVVVSFVLGCVLLYLLLILCNMSRPTRYFVYVVNVISCIYCGATTAAVFVYSVVWGILYAVLVSAEWLVTVCFACFVCVCEKPYCRRFCESARDLKQLAVVLFLGLLYKIIALFVILKLLTALI